MSPVPWSHPSSPAKTSAGSGYTAAAPAIIERRSRHWQTFDAANPEPMTLTPDVKCGECGSRMIPHPGFDMGQGRKVEASYSCPVRHEDGKFYRRAR
jgi:hypothetical protein